MPKRNQVRLAELTDRDLRACADEPDAAARTRARLVPEDQPKFDRAVSELGTARKAARNHFKAVLQRLDRSPGSVAAYIGRVVATGHLEEHDKWEFVLAAATGWRYIAGEGGPFDAVATLADRRGKMVQLLADAKHKESAGLALKFKDPRRQFNRWVEEGRKAGPCQVVFYKGGRRGRGVYIVPGIPVRTHVSLRGAAAGEWDPAQPTRPILVSSLAGMADLSDPQTLERFQNAMGKAASSINVKRLAQQVEQDRRAFIAKDTHKMMESEEDRALIIKPVAAVTGRNKKARKELLTEMAATDPELAEKLRHAGLID
jgi:hypothetical protein